MSKLSDSGVKPSPPSETRPPPRKRRRVVISCFECHRRKQKCDRALPCGNCVARNKEHSCAYEDGAPTLQSRRSKSSSEAATDASAKAKKSASVETATAARAPKADASLASMAAALGYSQTGSSTMGLLRSIEEAPQDADQISPDSNGTSQQQAPPSLRRVASMREKYKSLVRQLPSKMYIDKLINMFYAEFNTQYNFIDRTIFMQQLDEWNRMPFSALSSPDGGPHSLSPDLRAFPAVLFQMLACALLLLSPDGDPVFDALKYAGEMTFEDLAHDYSDSGMEILNLFGKQGVSLTTVQGQWTRSLFLKYIGRVTECWHALSVAIRDAQEIGMHRDSLDPEPADSTLESVLENQWYIQRRRKMYMILVSWDVHISVCLGRPDSIVWAHGLPSRPVDAPFPAEPRKTPVLARNPDREPPSLVSRVLWSFEVAQPLKDIQDLERDGAHPKDFSKVDRLHQQILDLEDRKPAFFRHLNPDTRWDDDPELSWLPNVRLYFRQLHDFALMALHRPYIFHREKSRSIALNASLQMLEMHRRTFSGLPPSSWRNFDAIVMVASIYILFPQEHPELRNNAVQQFHWTIERFTAMRDRNPLARSAQDVLKAIYARFILAVGRRRTPASVASKESPFTSSQSRSQSTPSSSLQSIMEDTKSVAPVSDIDIAPSTTQWDFSNWDFPSADSLAALAPIYPTTDLIYNDLMVVKDGESVVPEQSSIVGTSTQFGGDFGGDNNFWQLLNQYQ